MKKLLVAALATALAFACRKAATPLETPSFLAQVQTSLKDSLGSDDYASLDFARPLVSGIDSLHIKFVRIPVVSKAVSNDFFIAETDDAGRIIKARFVTVAKDTMQKFSFTGTLQFRAMKSQAVTIATFKAGHKISASSASSLMAAEDPVIDGGDLPPVVVSYTPDGGGGFSYADWYNLMYMAGDDGFSPSYYSPSSGGGGGGGSAPVEQIDFEPESQAAINLEQYLKCFGTVPNAGATYTLGIYTDIPVNDDPGKIFNWQTGAVGHSFITLTKTGSGTSVQQSIGFYPETGWKSIEANDPVPSKLEDNAGHEFNASLIVNIDAAHFGNVMNEMRYQASSRYDIDQFNCTDFALAAFNAGAPLYLSIPQYHLPGSMDGQVSNTPNGLYEELTQLNNSGGYEGGEITIPGVAGFVGGSHGPCN